MKLALRPTIPARERFYANTRPARRGNAPLRQTGSTAGPVLSRFGLRRERHGSRSTERAAELGEDRRIGVQPNPIQSTDAKWRELPLVLEASELAPRDSDALAAGDGLRRLADGAKVEWRPGKHRDAPQATNVRVI